MQEPRILKEGYFRVGATPTRWRVSSRQTGWQVEHMLSDTGLQVSVAVLLDNFVSASAHIDVLEQRMSQEEKRRRQETRNPLEPLLRRLAREYIDNADLSNRLSRLFQVNG
jgi:hypothetical protein